MLILASKSPRRCELLKLTEREFTATAPSCDEAEYCGEAFSDYVMSLARQKAQSLIKTYPDSVIIGADTVVTVDSELLGMPADAEDAKKMLRRLSGREHKVYTGVSLVCGDKFMCDFAVTSVRFRTLSDGEISEYVRSGEPMDKAGAYGIQGRGGRFAERVSGDYFNVVGLPVKLLLKMLSEFQTSLSE